LYILYNLFIIELIIIGVETLLKRFLFFLFIWSFAFPENINKQNSDSLNVSDSQKIIHLSGHTILPIAISYACYGSSWKTAAKIMIASNLVDADHLLAKPIYNPDRCSIGSHPLHSLPMIGLYSAMLFNKKTEPWGIGLLTHIVVDCVDCINTKERLGILQYPKLYREPVNTYSVGHIAFWYGMSQFSEIEVQQMLLSSLGWELIELYLPFKFTQESYLNKFFDILFGSLGFYIGKQTLR
tara:strand:+ start:9043 stop:9762 length:720 start_codon:yes stop_codon:yes gene_type:complete